MRLLVFLFSLILTLNLTASTEQFMNKFRNADNLNVALIGCGFRGCGALDNLLDASKITGVRITPVAFCDYFVKIAKSTARKYNKSAKCFGGATGYKKVMELPEVDVVLLCTPPNFRPLHFREAILHNKHVFEEKPVAVDPIGVRTHLKYCEIAVSNHITVVAGTQRRHHDIYRAQYNYITNGVVGNVVSGYIKWNQPASKRYSEVDEQNFKDKRKFLVKNWYYYEEMSGDHIVEQHIHNIDIANWYIGRYPISAKGFGGKARRDRGNIYDFFVIEFDYGDGVRITSECRQISDCVNEVSEWFRTDKNVIINAGKSFQVKDKEYSYESKLEMPALSLSPYVKEHVDLINSIIGRGEYYMEAENVTMSTAAAIIGRLSAKTGKEVRMSDIISNKSSEFYNMNSSVQPEDFENDEVPVVAPSREIKLPGSKQLEDTDEYLISM